MPLRISYLDGHGYLRRLNCLTIIADPETRPRARATSLCDYQPTHRLQSLRVELLLAEQVDEALQHVGLGDDADQPAAFDNGEAAATAIVHHAHGVEH